MSTVVTSNIFWGQKTSITLCFISFLGGGMIGMGTVLFVQGAFYNENKIEEKRNQSQINE